MATKEEMIILVNPEDKKIGVVEKILAHRFAMLHRAFSIFVYRRRGEKIEVLLQKRAAKKYHGGGLWTNTCCSHPHPGESLKSSAEARLFEEMGIKVKLKEVGKFHYVAKLKELYENEIDHVFVGVYNDEKIAFNKKEVDDYKWETLSALRKDLKARPQRYTPWLKQALELFMAATDLR